MNRVRELVAPLAALLIAALSLAFMPTARAAPPRPRGPETHSVTVSSRHHLPVSVTLPRYHGTGPLNAVQVSVRFDLVRGYAVDNVDNDQLAFVDFNAIASFQGCEVFHPSAGLLVHAETNVPTAHTATPAGLAVTFPPTMVENVHATALASGGDLATLFGGRGDITLPITSPAIFYTVSSTECLTSESTDMLVTVELVYNPGSG